eukprot:s647_g28.t1
MLPKYVALGGQETFVLSWPDGQVSWSGGLDTKLRGLLNGRYNNSGQKNRGISCISFADDRYAVCYEGGRWQFVCDSLSMEVMDDAGTISCLSLGPQGSYFVMGEQRLHWSGIPKRAEELIKTRKCAAVEWVALGTNGSYFLLFSDGVYYWDDLHPTLIELLQQERGIHRVFLSAEDESYFLQLEDGRAFWEVGEQFDSQISRCWYLAPSQIMFSHDKIGPVFSNGKYSIKDTFLSLHRGHLDPEDLPLMKVVQHQGSYVSINNRRLAVFRLLEMYVNSDLRVPVEFVQKTDSFYSRYSTRCNGHYVYLRHTEFGIGRTQDETNFDPFSHKLTKPCHQSSWRDSDSDSDISRSFCCGSDSDSDTS